MNYVCVVVYVHTHTHVYSWLLLLVIVCFSISQNTSNQRQPVVMLLGNKIDRSSERRVSRLKAEEVSRDNMIVTVVTSQPHDSHCVCMSYSCHMTVT